jgi:hypothetical protein
LIKPAGYSSSDYSATGWFILRINDFYGYFGKNQACSAEPGFVLGPGALCIPGCIPLKEYIFGENRWQILINATPC